jgi:hypothetical protein
MTSGGMQMNACIELYAPIHRASPHSDEFERKNPPHKLAVIGATP